MMYHRRSKRGRGKVVIILIMAMVLIITSIILYIFLFNRNITIERHGLQNITETKVNLKIYSASLSCSYVDPKAMVIYGDCIFILNVENNGSEPILIQTLTFSNLQLKIFIGEEVKSRELRIIRKSFSLSTPVEVTQLLTGILETSLGRLRVEFMISI